VLNALAGTKFKLIPGYRGGTDIDFAMQRGEAAGRGSANWSGMKLRPDWITGKKINILLQVDPRRITAGRTCNRSSMTCASREISRLAECVVANLVEGVREAAFNLALVTLRRGG